MLSCSTTPYENFSDSRRFEWNSTADSQQNRELSSKKYAINEFYKFDNWDQAFKIFKQNKELNATLPKVIGKENKEVYKKANAAVAKVLRVFLKLFPHLQNKISADQSSASKARVFTIVISSDESSSFVAGQSGKETKKTPIIILRESVLVNGENGEPNYGVIAHELTHMLLQNFSVGSVFPKNLFYNIDNVDLSKILIEQVNEKNALQYDMSLWSEYANWAGDLSTADIPDVYYTHNIKNHYFVFWLLKYILTKKSCAKKSNLFNSSSLEQSLIKYGGIDQANSKVLNFDRQLILNQLTHKMNIIKDCLGDDKLNIFDVLKVNNLNLSRSYSSKNDYYKAWINSSKDKDFVSKVIAKFEEQTIFNAMRSVISEARVRMRALEEKIDFLKIRNYTLEHHADEIAVLVMREMKLSIAPMFSTSVFNKNKDSVCKTVPKTQPYSPVSFLHSTPCWRYWRASHLKPIN